MRKGGRTPVYTAAMLAEARRLYVSGLSSEATADALQQRFCVRPSSTWVRKWLRREGLLRSRGQANSVRWARRRSWTTRDALRLFVVERRTVPEIAATLGTNDNAVRSALKRSGAQPPGPSEAQRLKYARAREKRRAMIAELRRQKLTYAEIRALTGWSDLTIWRALRDLGMLVGRGRRNWKRDNAPAEVAAC